MPKPDDYIPRVVLEVDNNRGYAADQVPTRTTLGDLLRLIEEAIDYHGEEMIVVTKDSSARYGANWGAITAHQEIVHEDFDEEFGDE